MKCYSCMRKVSDKETVCPHCGAKLVMDQEMFIRAKEGDSDTISALYSMAYEPMRVAANSVLHNASDAEDAAMDAVETMLQRIHQLDKPESFLPWAKQIATNKAKDYVKKKKPVLIAEAEDDEAPGFWEKLEEVDTANMPEFTMERREGNRLIRDAAKALGKDLYEVLKCAYVDEMKLSEISEKLGVNLNTIKTRKRTAEKKMYEWAMEQEKDGVYLHGMSPIEFWLWLLRNSKGGAGFRFDPGNLAKIVEGSSAITTATATAGKLAKEAASSGVLEKIGQTISSVVQNVSSGFAEVFATTASRVAAIIAAAVIGVGGIGGTIIYENHKANEKSLAEESQTTNSMPEDEKLQESSMRADRLTYESSELSLSNATSVLEDSTIPSTVDIVFHVDWKNADVDNVETGIVLVRLDRVRGTTEAGVYTENSQYVYVTGTSDGLTYTWQEMPWGPEFESDSKNPYFYRITPREATNGNIYSMEYVSSYREGNTYYVEFEGTLADGSKETEPATEESIPQTGTIYIDVRGYSLQSDGSVGKPDPMVYAGTIVNLKDVNGTTVSSFTTDMDHISFTTENMSVGEYYIEVIPVERDGYTVSVEGDGRIDVPGFRNEDGYSHIDFTCTLTYERPQVEAIEGSITIRLSCETEDGSHADLIPAGCTIIVKDENGQVYGSLTKADIDAGNNVIKGLPVNSPFSNYVLQVESYEIDGYYFQGYDQIEQLYYENPDAAFEIPIRYIRNSTLSEVPSSMDVKYWIDWTDVIPPEQLVVSLVREYYNDGFQYEDMAEPIVLSEANNWTYTWEDMPWGPAFVVDSEGVYKDSYRVFWGMHDLGDQDNVTYESGANYYDDYIEIFDRYSLVKPEIESSIEESSIVEESSAIEENQVIEDSSASEDTSGEEVSEPVVESSKASETNSVSNDANAVHIHTFINKTHYVRTIEATLGDDFGPYYDYWICWICGKQCLAMPKEVYDTLTIYDATGNIILVSDEDGFRKHVAEEDSTHVYTLEGNPSGQIRYSGPEKSGESITYYETFQQGLGYNQPGYEYEDENNCICTQCGEYVPESEQQVTDSYYVCDICGASFPVNDGSVDLVDTDIEKHMREAHPYYSLSGELVEYGGISFYEGSYEKVTVAEAR